MADTGCVGSFIKPEDAAAVGLPILGSSKKITAVANNGIRKSHHRTLLPYDLPPTAREADTVPVFGQSLVGIKLFDDTRCISIFNEHKGGVIIHNHNDIKIEFLAPPAFPRNT